MENDYLTAPCGLECHRCDHFLANSDPAVEKRVRAWSEDLHVSPEKMICHGCRHQKGRIPLQLHLFGKDHQCATYHCAKRKKVDYCGTCGRFPCDMRHPYTVNADLLDRRTRAFLCV